MEIEQSWTATSLDASMTASKPVSNCRCFSTQQNFMPSYDAWIYYSHLTAFFQDILGKPAPEKYTILDFTGARDDEVAVASALPCANHLHLLQTDNRASTSPLSFYSADALPAAQPAASKH